MVIQHSLSATIGALTSEHQWWHSYSHSHPGSPPFGRGVLKEFFLPDLIDVKEFSFRLAFKYNPADMVTSTTSLQVTRGRFDQTEWFVLQSPSTYGQVACFKALRCWVRCRLLSVEWGLQLHFPFWSKLILTETVGPKKAGSWWECGCPWPSNVELRCAIRKDTSREPGKTQWRILASSCQRSFLCASGFLVAAPCGCVLIDLMEVWWSCVQHHIVIWAQPAAVKPDSCSQAEAQLSCGPFMQLTCE